ncbi:penicillin acylase family protein [Leptothrix discophora]|uniref:Penicillin acylase family protein n=1 Tax=Leptothrix discophora TaxID=89 RepID=A0ABT9FZ66_LEPDI|nr:penicillin acylase family protein [Leptothrix discophora]MDP4299534.1 penicillin acylase family protein [Leptothrix discophora]
MNRRLLRRLALWTLSLLLLGMVLLMAGYAAYRQRVLPMVDGTRTVRSVYGDLRIARDGWGVPTIEADRREGAWFGLGYAHAQDRLWQLELHRRIGAGRLAEAFGPEALDNDRFLRALGVRRAAEAQWARLDGETRTALEAYAAGVNSWMTQHLSARPPEFLLLGIRPEPWTPVDSLAWSIMMAWDLGGNWSTELLRLRLAARMDLARIQQILPPYPGESPLAVADYTELARQWQVHGGDTVERLIGMAPESGVEGVGSNNWAVDGRRTTRGMPLVANDPHLRLSTPALWYVARLSAPGLHVGGGTIPGLPVVVVGQNDAVAWAFTNTNPDVQDLYLEAVDPADPMRYRTPDGWARFEEREELIAVRGQAQPVRLRLRHGRHGPVISDAASRAFEGLTGRAGQPYALALRWTALDADVSNLVAGIGFNRAGSIEDFIAAARDYGVPMQNMIVADRRGPHGRIAMVLPGRVPVRAPDNDLQGQFPAPGWLARYDWTGYLPERALPVTRDPPDGWLASANQRTTPAGYAPLLTREWTRPHRQQRIEQLLAATPKHDVDSFSRMQLDVRSQGALVLLPAFRAARLNGSVEDVDAAAIVRIQASFDGEMTASAIGPSLFHAWVQALTRRILADELGALWGRQFSERRSWRDALEDILARQDAWWCDDKSTSDRQESCPEQVDAALRDAVDDLRQRLGNEPSTWRWERLHVVRAEHSPFSRVAPLRRLFELRVPVAGDAQSVNAMRVNLRPDPGDPQAYASEHGPSLRTIFDLADPANSRVMLSTGQSGIPLSPDYASLIGPWAEGRTIPLWPSRPAAHVLSLRAIAP